jgi:hypothetical protein
LINVVTKSGTNTWTGEVFEYYRDKSLNAIDLINKQQNRPKSPYHFNQFGGSIGGPLRRDRDFLFANSDSQQNTLPNLVFLNVPPNSRLRRDVTLNVGLRYAVQKFAKREVRNPDPQLAAVDIDTSFLPTDKNNFGPRLGVAWNPVGHPYVLRAGYGIFYGRTPSIMVGTAHSNNGINVQTITFTGAQMPAYPNVFSSLPTGAALPRPTIFTFSRDYENASVQQANTAFEWQVAPQTALTVTYLHVTGDSLPRSTDLNIGAP